MRLDPLASLEDAGHIQDGYPFPSLYPGKVIE
jgi:hypothetical protein